MGYASEFEANTQIIRYFLSFPAIWRRIEQASTFAALGATQLLVPSVFSWLIGAFGYVAGFVRYGA
jgi:hypothetical protein